MTNESIHTLYDQLSLSNQEVVSMLIRNLAEREGIEAVDESKLYAPKDGVELWGSQLALDGLVEATIEQYRQRVLSLLTVYEHPTDANIREFLKDILKAGETPEKGKGTVTNYIKAFRSFFRYLYENKLWNTNPTLRLKQPTIHYIARRAPTEDEVRKLFNVINDPDDYIPIRLLAQTGLRVSEMCERELRDVDLEQARIDVTGKGHKQRFVALMPSTVELLKSYVELLRKRNEKWLFPTRRQTSKSGHINRSTIKAMLNQHCAKAHIEHISPHQLRHFFATFMLSHGGDLKAVSELLGHADVAITLQIYHHTYERSIRDMVNKLAPMMDRLALPPPTIEGEARLIED